jgi:hypothetical protein
MGNLLATEDIDDNYYAYEEEPVKPEKRKRRTRARTAKRREEPRATVTEGFSLFTDPGEPLEDKDDIIESLNLESEYREPAKPRRKKRGTTVSRKKRSAWGDDFEY